MASSPEESAPKMASSCMNAPKIMVFRPTLEEMKDFSAYIAYMESKGAHLAGVAKVIPPKEFVPRKSYDDLEMTIPAPIQQEVMGHQGLYTQYNIQKKAMTVQEYKKLANSTKYCTPAHFDYEDLERKYWKNITYNSPIYGADISGSIYDKGWNIWNINKLNTVLDLIEEEEGVKIEGVNTAYMYFGMWKTTFAWHTEDMDLYSINYIHYGAPKTWYAIPTEHARRLERLASGFFPGSFADCSNFLRHKMTVIAPYILKKYSIPFDKITQECGEFMITFPYGYHSGFNHGFNIAESTNFASVRWIDFGKRATSCVCTKDSVKIGMNPFVRVFQPDRYQAWIEGRDIVYLPEVDGPNPPTVSHKPPVTSPEKLTQGKQIHRRHPVHKKGIIGETTRKRPRAPSKSKNSSEQVPEKKGSAKRKKRDEKEKRSEKRKTKREKTVIVKRKNKEGKDLKKKLKKIKKKLEKKKKPEKASSPTKKTKSSPETGVTKVRQVCDLVQLAEVAERVIASQGLEVPSGASGGSLNIKVEVDASGDSMGQGGASLNRSMNNYDPVRRIGGENLSSVHTYSVSSSSRRKKTKPKKNVQASAERTSQNSNSQGVRVKSENGQSSAATDSAGKYTQRAASLLPTRTNTDGTPAASNTGPKGSKELSKMKNNWVRSMNGLWSIQPPQFISEQVHNLSMADQKPGCCVCMLFYNEKADITEDDDEETSSTSVRQETSQDQRLRVLCPEMCFACCSENPTPLIENPAVDALGRSPIINCVSCKIAVHAACYGVDPATIVGDWKCTRCEDEDWQDIACCLCNLRGGALKPTTTGHWAHIVCAMAITEVSFQNVKLRSPIDVTKISPQRLKLKCYYCRSFIKCSPKYASCIQCSVGKCALSFHVTCAKAAGVIMEPSDWPYPVYVTCCRHPFANKDLVRRPGLKEISTGERVIAKHKNSRYYEAEVIGEREQMFCHVNFFDNSFSENLFPEDIESHDIQSDGPPAAGTRVKVRWTDGLVYDGTYVKDSFIKIYDVEFQDGSIVTVKRDDIYQTGEDIPKRVKIRLSVASEMRHQDFYGSEVIDEKHRQVSSRYATPSPTDTEQPDNSAPSEESDPDRPPCPASPVVAASESAQ